MDKAYETLTRRIDDRLPTEPLSWGDASAQPQATALTNEQISAGAAVHGDDGQPVGRNTAIMVFDAMTGAATSGDAPTDLQELYELARAADKEAAERGEWFNVFQLCDGVTLDACAAFIAAADPKLVLHMIGRIDRIERAAAPAAPAGQLDAGCAVDAKGTVYHNVAEIYHQAEECEALHMWLDDQGVPRTESDGRVFSSVGRVMRLVPNEVIEKISNALALAMTICDAVPTRAHDLAEDESLRHLGKLVNCDVGTGQHGYAVIRDGQAAFAEVLASRCRAQGGNTNNSQAESAAAPADTSDKSKPCRNVLMRAGYSGVPKSCPRCGLSKECPAGHVKSVREGGAAEGGRK